MLDRKTKLLAFVCVVLAHVAMMYLISHIRPNVGTSEDRVIGEWILLPPLKVETIRSPVKTLMKRKDKVSQLSTTESHTEEKSTVITLPETDWYGSASEVIARRLNAPKAREFGVKKKPQREDADTPKSVFNERVHKKNDVEKIDGGELITWISYMCYVVNTASPSIPMESGHPATVCWGNAGKPPADGDLFIHLKPSYLQLPQPKDVERKNLEKQQ